MKNIWAGPYLEISCDEGYLVASHHEGSGLFLIADIEVEKGSRGNGIGESLLNLALQEAMETDARVIYAAIISRECLSAMSTVFGADSLIVEETGSYEDEGAQKCSATLWYLLDKQAMTLPTTL